jgi:Cu(I)/Ag(I) efflux system periplasmic protein CusF
MMKHLAILAATFALSAAAHAQGMKGMDMKDHKGMDMKTEKKDAKASVHKATGVVTRMDKDKVTIKHEPVASLNWPVMTMSFKVKDMAVMEKMKKDQKVDFEFVQEGKDYVVTGVK